MYRIEGHCHSTFSDGRMTMKRIFAIARARGLSGAIVADHNTVRHQKECMRVAERLGMLTFPAVEITASFQGRKCHVLGYGIEELPGIRELEDVLDFIRESGGIAIAAHPFGDHGGCRTVEMFDAVELNGSVISAANRTALAHAVSHGKPVVAGSDAHMPWELGRAVMESESPEAFESPDNFKRFLMKGRIVTRVSRMSWSFPLYKAKRMAGKLLL